MDMCFSKVTDFGLAKVKNEMTRYSHCTHNVGTRRWMAPEIFGANKDDDHLEHAYPLKADVYSFGLICFEILSGKEPYNDVQMSSLYSELTRPFPLRPQLPSNCPTALLAVIDMFVLECGSTRATNIYRCLSSVEISEWCSNVGRIQRLDLESNRWDMAVWEIATIFRGAEPLSSFSLQSAR